MIKPNGRQFHLFFEYQIFCLQCLWNLFEMIGTWPVLKWVSIVCGFFQIFSARPFSFWLIVMLLCPTFRLHVRRPQRPDKVACLPDDINDINSRVCVSPYVCAHVCRGKGGTTERLLSINILAVINSCCQKEISSLRKHPKKQPLALACWARLPGWWSNSSAAAVWAGREVGN